jgi:DNA polymerase-3 subunit alpha/error-prone DNA polymerase
MEFFRHRLPTNTKRAIDVYSLYEGQEVTVGGWAIARQHPSGNKGTVFVTVEDETGDVQLIVWRDVFDQYKHLLKEPLLLATGFISNWDGTTNIVVSRLKAITATAELPAGHDWH